MTKTIYLIALFTGVSEARAPAATVKANYHCSDGTTLVVKFENTKQGRGSVRLMNVKTGKVLVLLQGQSADGGRYASATAQFWIKGNQATFTRDGQDVVCKTKS